MIFNGKRTKPDIFLDGECLEVVSEYKYLGVWFDSKLNWKLHKETILRKAKKRAYIMMGFGIYKLLPASTCVRLWEVLVRPILEYASEVWGRAHGKSGEAAEEIGRLILGVPTQTPNEMVLGDLGWWELKARRDKARLKLLKKLSELDEGEYARDLVNDKLSIWRVYSDKILHSLKLSKIEYKMKDQREWRATITDRMQSHVESQWRENMKRKAKLRTYVTIKDKLQAEPYLHFKNRLARISLARLRGGTSFLRIETGRYEKEKPEERLCLWCSNAIEDEKHFLLECNLYRSIRQKTLEHLNLDATHPGRAELIRMMGGGKWKSAEEEVLAHHIVHTRKLRERFLELL